MKQAELVAVGLCGQSIFLQVDHFHRPEETLHARAFFAEPGGKGYNQAVAAARLGAGVAFLGAVGQDADGDACAMRLLQEGVESGLIFKAGAHTAYAAILTSAAGENRVTVYPGAAALLTGADIRARAAVFDGASWVLLTPEIPEDAFAEATAQARRSGAQLIINPAPYQPWVLPYLREAYCITPNRSEARSLLALGDGDDLEDALRQSPYRRAVVTLGGDGALCLETGKITRLPAPRVRPVDTTGAGDTLNGALCAALIQKKPLLSAAAYAVAAASLSVARAHALDGMPTQAEMAAFFKEEAASASAEW